MSRSTTRTTRTALALAVLAVVLPTAAAARPDDRDQGVVTQESAKPIASRDFSMASQAGSASVAVRPDDRSGARGVGEALPLDPAIATAIAESVNAAGPSYTPQELQALIRYSNANFQAKQALLAGTDDSYGHALMIRSQALNAKYGEDPYTRALRIRGEGLNTLYGGGSETAVRPDDRGGIRTVGPVSATQASSSGFDWGDAVIGAIGAAGLSLLVAGGMLLTFHLVHQRRDRVAAL
jgi:hypothetical protein